MAVIVQYTGPPQRRDSPEDRAATLRVLVDYLTRPLYTAAPAGTEIDPDLITADNLAREAALKAIRASAIGLLDPAH
jgi:hypothetical protein